MRSEVTHENLSTYLNDHLAGSVVALELLDHLKQVHTGTELAMTMSQFHDVIESGQVELRAIIKKVGDSTSTTRAAIAWIGEKATRLKLRLDDQAEGNFRLLEATEIVAMGIHGKQSLWQLLATLSQELPDLRGPDYAQLIDRAKDQRERIESVRTEAAQRAFVASPDSP